MMVGGLAFLCIFTLIGAWNDDAWPLIVLVDPQRQTLQVALAQLNSTYGTDYGMVMAGALIRACPNRSVPDRSVPDRIAAFHRKHRGGCTEGREAWLTRRGLACTT